MLQVPDTLAPPIPGASGNVTLARGDRLARLGRVVTLLLVTSWLAHKWEFAKLVCWQSVWV